MKPEGTILRMEERRNAFTRYNQKGRAVQTLAANVDLVLSVTTPSSPPFRPRFTDRLLVQAGIDGIPAAIVLNKIDLDSGDPAVRERLQDYSRNCYPVFPVSASTGEGLEELRAVLRGKRAVFAGQSGVGKSSLINALQVSGKELQRTGVLNKKYDRGSHVTVMGRLIGLGDGMEAVDTPGVRRLAIHGISAGELDLYMPEFAAIAGTCAFGASCTHTSEPGCRVLEAVMSGAIHEDRYQSYLSIRAELP